MNCDQTWRSFG